MADTTVDPIQKALSEVFDPAEVRWKPQAVSGNRAMAIAYVDARVIQDRLDDVLGISGWQTKFTVLPEGSVVCALSVRINNEWITKEDVGSQSDQPDDGDKMKAAFSDALKRAAVHFGISRYLYRLPHQWVDWDAQKKHFVRTPQLPAWAIPQQNAPVKQPAKAPAAKKSSTMPATGEELLKRLTYYEAKLVAQKVCADGELVSAVRDSGVKAGCPEDMNQWAGSEISDAVGHAKAFEAAKRQSNGVMA